MDITQEKINGLNTLFIHQPGSHAASVQMWFRAGSSLEKKPEEGIAHFLEHMFFKGTKKRPGAKIASDVESYGGEINAFTSFDYTCYYINSPSKNVKDSLSILMDMVANPEFKSTEIPPERGVVFEEYLRSQDNPNQFNFQKIQENCFKGGYKHPILGREKTIKNFSRKQLTDFRKNYYNLSNSMLVVAGDIDKINTLKTEISKYKLPRGPESSFENFKLGTKPSLMISQKPVRMVTTTLIIQAPNFESESAAQEDLALNSFGYGESSTLYKKLVLENSICNSCSSSTMFFSKGGVHFIRFSCPEENLEKACESLTKVISATLVNEIPEKEIEKIKNQYIAYKVYEKETIESFAFSLGHGFAQNGNIHCEKDFLDNIAQAAPKRINQAFKNVFRKAIHLNIQAPLDADKSNLELLGQKLLKDLNHLVPDEATNKASKKSSITKSKFDPNVKSEEIIPGVKLIHRENKMSPTFNLYAFVRGGLINETSKNNGIHHVMSSMLTKGHDGKAFEEVKSRLDFLSSSLQGFAGKNSFGLNMHGLSKSTSELFDLFFNSLLKPNFEKRMFDIEKEILLRNLESYEEDPVKQCFKMVNEKFFKDHPYSRRVVGSKESISSLDLEMIKDLYGKLIKSNQITFTYCGDQGFDTVKELILDRVGELGKRSSSKRVSKIAKPVQESTTQHKNLDREQTQIFLGQSSYAYGTNEDIYLKIFTTHLQGQGSELFVDVRDKKGLCYVVQPINFSALDGGYWGIYMASGHEKTPMAIEAINELLNKYKNKGFSKAQFNRVIKMILGQEALNVQTNDDYAQIYSVPVLQDLGLDFHHKRLEKIQSIKLEAFNKFLKSFLKKNRSIITVGRD